MGLLSFLKKMARSNKSYVPKQKRVQPVQPLPPFPEGMTIHEETLMVLIKEALWLAVAAETPSDIAATEFELHTLRKQLDLREAAQLLAYKRLGMQEPMLLTYQGAVQSCRSQIEQGLMELEHKRFMLSR